MTPSAGAEDLFNQIQIDDMDGKSPNEIANFINTAFLDPLNIYQPLASLPPYDPNDSVLQLDELDVYKVLASLNPRKASGPDGVSNWVLNEYAEILAQPVCSILNSSFNEQQLPTSWKTADIVPIIKSKPVTEICKHLRPISLTPALSKVAEEFVVSKHIGPAILCQIDPNQFGVIPKSSTSMAAISMIHNWSQSTDGSGAAVRIVLFDYKKAFDLIDHGILAEKISRLPIPKAVVRWAIDFLQDRKQRVKLANDCVSEWGAVPAGVPQGTKLGPWLFLLMINDLKITEVSTWKYVDDTTVSEVVKKGDTSKAQDAVSTVENWSSSNGLHLNADKCKELLVDFKTTKQSFDPLTVNGKKLPVVKSAKILGLTISSNLKWTDHINEVIKKANKRLYFIILLKRAKVSPKDIVNFYCTVIRPILEYCAPVFHYSIPSFLSEDLEMVQKRALKIILPTKSYNDILEYFNVQTLSERRDEMSTKLFTNIVNNPAHKLHKLLPSKHESVYQLRNTRMFEWFETNTDRFKNTFIPKSIKLSQRNSSFCNTNL